MGSNGNNSIFKEFTEKSEDESGGKGLLSQIKDLQTDKNTDYHFGTLANADKMKNVQNPIIPSISISEASSYHNPTTVANSTDNSSDTDKSEQTRNVHSQQTTEKSTDYKKSSKLQYEEDKRAKMQMLKKLAELSRNGVKLSQKYSMNSSLEAMEIEYEIHKSMRDKQNGVKWMSNMMLNGCWGLEIANENFNPFDVHLSGWTEQLNNDIGDYQDVLGELYDKYFQGNKPIPPEIKLFFLLSGSALRFHFQSQLWGTDNMESQLNNNPELLEKLRSQAANNAQQRQNGFNEYAQKQQREAEQKAADITKIREQERMYNELQKQTSIQQQMMQDQLQQQALMHQQMLEKNRKMEELQKQLDMMQSDSHSLVKETKHTTVQPPMMPKSLRSNIDPRPAPKPNFAGMDVELPKFSGLSNNNDNGSRISENSTLDFSDMSGSEEGKKKTTRRKKSGRILKIETSQ